ncbi:MAG: MFS transporter [Sphingorhabdus sp.]
MAKKPASREAAKGFRRKATIGAPPLDKNSWAIIWIGAMAQAGMALSPLLIGAFSRIGFSDFQSGLLLSTEYAGMLLSSMLVSRRLGQLRQNKLIMFVVIGAIVCNATAFFLASFSLLMPIRFANGMCIGTILAFGNARLAHVSAPAKLAGYRSTITIAVGLTGIMIDPLLIGLVGVSAIFLLLSAVALLIVPAMLWLDKEPGQPTVSRRLSPFSSVSILPLCLYAAIQLSGAFVWTFALPIGTAGGLPAVAINAGLAVSSAVVIAISLSAEPIRRAIGWRPALTLAILAYAPGTILMINAPSPFSFGAGLVLVNLTASLGGLMMMDYLARTDKEGRVAASAASVLALCNMLAPTVAGWLMGYGGPLWLVAGGVSIIFCGFILSWRVSRQYQG